MVYHSPATVAFRYGINNGLLHWPEWAYGYVFLRNARTGKKIAKAEGTLKGLEPLNLENVHGPPYNHPQYEIITVGRTTEVIEHRKMEPIFYVTDDPSVLSKLGLSK
jgi:hypothetical protein